MGRAFFSHEDGARRRMRTLSRKDLIRSHRKGLPIGLNYSAWRLSPKGLASLQVAFPRELQPERLSEKLAEGSLINADHREALGRLYLELLLSGREKDIGSRECIAAMRQRADQLQWQPDGDVVLRFANDGVGQEIVPDTTVLGLATGQRVFIEMHRGTKSLVRVSANLERYRTFLRHHYGSVYPDGATPAVLYVVPYRSRVPGVTKVAKKVLGDAVEWAVLLEGDTTAWLEGQLIDRKRLGAPIPVVSPPPPKVVRESELHLRDASWQVFEWANSLFRHLRNEGLVETVFRPDPELLSDGKAKLDGLYNLLKEVRDGD
jgi:hypothetical protein